MTSASANSNIPQHTLDSIMDYVNNGVATGGFLTAVLSNDLAKSFTRADKENLEAMGAIVSFIMNKIPAQCHGSTSKVNAWCAAGGSKGHGF